MPVVYHDEVLCIWKYPIAPITGAKRMMANQKNLFFCFLLKRDTIAQMSMRQVKPISKKMISCITCVIIIET